MYMDGPAESKIKDQRSKRGASVYMVWYGMVWSFSPTVAVSYVVTPGICAFKLPVITVLPIPSPTIASLFFDGGTLTISSYTPSFMWMVYHSLPPSGAMSTAACTVL